MNFERAGEIHRDLISLLRAKSAKFDEFMKTADLNSLFKSDKKSLPKAQAAKPPIRQSPVVDRSEDTKGKTRKKVIGSNETKNASKTVGNSEQEKHQEKIETEMAIQPSERWKVIGLRGTGESVRNTRTKPSGDQDAMK